MGMKLWSLDPVENLTCGSGVRRQRVGSGRRQSWILIYPVINYRKRTLTALHIFSFLSCVCVRVCVDFYLLSIFFLFLLLTLLLLFKLLEVMFVIQSSGSRRVKGIVITFEEQCGSNVWVCLSPRLGERVRTSSPARLALS